MVAQFSKSSWRNVTKSNPCPLCGRPDWCSISGDEEAVVCARTDIAPDGWSKLPRQSRDGRNIFAKQSKKAPRQRATRHWIYRDRSGQPIARVVRTDDGSGGRRYTQQRCENGRWVGGLAGVDRADIPIYRYHEVRQAIASGELIFITEGESCADALWNTGLPATCNIGGSGKFLASDASDLDGATVIICPDRDAPGIKHAEAIAKFFPEAKWLYAFPGSYWWEHLPPSQGLDIADWIESGASKDEILAAISDKRDLAPATEPPAESNKPEQQTDPDARLKLEVLAYVDTADPVKRTRLRGQICSHYRISAKDLDALASALKNRVIAPKTRVFSGKDFLFTESPGVRWLVPGRLAATGVTVCAGTPGSGKSTLLTDAAAAILYGDEFLGEVPSQQGKVLFVNSDEGSIVFAQERFINRGYAPDDNWQVMVGWDVSQKEELEAKIDAFRPALVVVDSLAGIHLASGIDENSTQAGESVRWLDAMSGRYNCAIALVHHANKNKEQKGVSRVRGNGDIAAASSMVWVLEGEGETKTLSTPKTRGIEPFNLKIRLDAQTGRYSVIEGAADGDEVRSLADRILKWLQANHPAARLETAEIAEGLGVSQGANLWKSLDRLVKSGQMIRRPSQVDRRKKVYGLPKIEDKGGTPPPYPRLSLSSNFSETLTQTELEPSQNYWTNYSTNTGQITRQILDNPSKSPCPVSPECSSDIGCGEITGQTSVGGGGVSPALSEEEIADYVEEVAIATPPEQPPQFKVNDRVEAISDPEEGIGIVECLDSGRYGVKFLQGDRRRYVLYEAADLRLAPPDCPTLGIVIPPAPRDEGNPKARRLKR